VELLQQQASAGSGTLPITWDGAPSHREQPAKGSLASGAIQCVRLEQLPALPPARSRWGIRSYSKPVELRILRCQDWCAGAMRAAARSNACATSAASSQAVSGRAAIRLSRSMQRSRRRETILGRVLAAGSAERMLHGRARRSYSKPRMKSCACFAERAGSGPWVNSIASQPS